MIIEKIKMTPSDSFWNNAPAMISSIGVILISLFGIILNYKVNNVKKTVDKVGETVNTVGENVNGKMTQLLQAKDDIALVKEADIKLQDAKKASHDSGKLEAMQEQKKDEALKNTNPEK